MASWILSAMLCAVAGANSDCTIVHFTAAWCEPCKQLEPALQQLRQEGWTIETVDTDRQPELVQQFRVQNLPTLAIVCRGQEVDRMVGAASYERIAERVQRAAARNQGSPAATPATARASSQTAPQSHQPIVRGQSPNMGGFPLLASNDSNTPARFAVDDLTANNAVQATLASRSQVTSAAAPAAADGARPSPTAQTTLSPQQAIARAAAATVRIRVDEANSTAYGTGTIIDVRGQEALILTCGHLFRDMQPNSQLTIDLFPGTPQEVNLPSELIDFKADQEDIGLISFRIPVAIEPVSILGRGQQVAVGQPAFSFGCDRGANPTRRDTQIKSINRYLGADNIEIVGAPVVGRSGGGLFDMQGRLIGVCNAANAEDDEGIYASAEVVFAQIERLGLSELFDEGQPAGHSQFAANGSASSGSASSGPVQLASTTTQSGSQSSAQGWQQPSGQVSGQPSTATQSIPPAAVGQAKASGGDTLHWPDQSASVPYLGASNHSRSPSQASGEPAAGGPALAGAGDGQQANASNAQQVICIVRDASGRDQVVTIDAPPPQLLQMIQQSQRR